MGAIDLSKKNGKIQYIHNTNNKNLKNIDLEPSRFEKDFDIVRPDKYQVEIENDTEDSIAAKGGDLDIPSTLRIEKELESIHLANYHLSHVKENLPTNLISKKNFNDIQSISKNFPHNITTFLGFETRLWESDNRVDFAFAVSGVGTDREILKKLLANGSLPSSMIKKPEWKKILDFSRSWSTSNSSLKNKVQCLWIEFDMPDEMSEIPAPRVFFGPAKLPSNIKHNDPKNYLWLTEEAIPLLRGEEISEDVKVIISDCIKKLPKGASLFQVGASLSEEKESIRLYINKIKPKQIIPYLIEIGWQYKTDELSDLVEELKEFASRFVLSYDITEDGLGAKIGLELSFIENNYHKEQRWEKLLNYLVKKQLCIPEKRDALLQYQGGLDQEEYTGGILKPITTASKIMNESSTKYLRYINHIKIVYEYGNEIKAKAYPAFRLFKTVEDTTIFRNKA